MIAIEKTIQYMEWRVFANLGYFPKQAIAAEVVVVEMEGYFDEARVVVVVV